MMELFRPELMGVLSLLSDYMANEEWVPFDEMGKVFVRPAFHQTLREVCKVYEDDEALTYFFRHQIGDQGGICGS